MLPPTALYVSGLTSDALVSIGRADGVTFEVGHPVEDLRELDGFDVVLALHRFRGFPFDLLCTLRRHRSD